MTEDRREEERMGLRERKKMATRRALREAAVRLALEHGLENVTVEDVAADVGVSTRTFFNYFGTKEEALLGELPGTLDEEATREFAAGGPTGDFTDDLIGLLIAFLLDTEDLPRQREEMRLRKLLMDREPQLVPGVLARFHDMEQVVARAIAERTGEPPESDRPQLAAVTAMAVMRHTMRQLRYSEGEDAARIRARVRTAFRVLGEVYAPR
ncbi:DNA-binding transcriptional regulator, AcrR family [Nocardiopsis flavescens]|uniref:DNA-binding transcriptional regulator, AcrR family n=2 Tax=Nocardiopsis flavescens TaxID=758803 RepID=A0A1M6NRV8_9ACTN|nr:DNA-binding transcriptional regulator, AcrR family [Nocardiopsis flavescens]